MWKNWSTAYHMCKLCHWYIHWHVSSPKYTESEIPLFLSEWFEIFQSFSTCPTCLLLFLYYLPNHSICMLYLKNSILQTNQFCWNYLHSECLHWGVDFEELLQRGKDRRFSCELCRCCWAQLTWCTPAQTLVFSTYKKINREAASHMVPLEEEIMIQVTCYFGFGLTYCIESLKQNCKYFFERVCKEHCWFI